MRLHRRKIIENEIKEFKGQFQLVRVSAEFLTLIKYANHEIKKAILFQNVLSSPLFLKQYKKEGVKITKPELPILPKIGKKNNEKMNLNISHFGPIT